MDFKIEAYKEISKFKNYQAIITYMYVGLNECIGLLIVEYSIKIWPYYEKDH